MEKMKKLLLFILVFFNFLIVKAEDLRDQIIPQNHEVLWNAWDGTWPLDAIIVYVKNFTFSIMWIIVVWVFLYLWFKLITSRWNAEEMKKALMWLVYVWAWLTIMSLAWWAVKLVSSLTF